MTRGAAQRIGIWVAVLGLYWITWLYLWPLVRGEDAGDEPMVWVDEQYGVVCYLRGDQMQCLYIPDFEAESDFREQVRQAAS